MIADIRLQHFRSYTDESFELAPGVNIIVGPNASGKTNLLESILVVARGGSYRVHDNELMQFGRPWARLVAHTTAGDSRIIKLDSQNEQAKKQFEINSETYRRLGLEKTLPTVMFEPNDMQILEGSPELRRQFLDDLLERTVAAYGATRRQFRRALSQRNILLKKGYSSARGQIFVWNIRLSELGAQIAKARSGLIHDMNEQAQDIYRKLSGSKAKAEFEYVTKHSINNYATELLHKLEAGLEDDCERGFTTYGPHRDDLQIQINGHAIQEVASRGELRTLLLVCKVLEARLIEQARGVKPILLLDDVFSELDGARRQALTKFLQPYQSFITTTDADVVLQHFTESSHIIPLSVKGSSRKMNS